MSESDGMDDVVDNGMRQTLLMASRIAETLARRRQESQQQQEHQDVSTGKYAKREIGRIVGVSRGTVDRALESDRAPKYQRAAGVSSLMRLLPGFGSCW